MHYTTQPQQLTTCPQCDNVVRVDAEFCNICGKQLQPASPRGQTQHNHTLAPSIPHIEEVYEDDDEYLYEDEDDDEAADTATNPDTARLPSAPGEILHLLHRLQEQSAQIERYFPAGLSDKTQKLLAWKKQLQRAYACAELFERPQLQQLEPNQSSKLRHHLADAAHALDFTREYAVKLIGHTGAGKSTLLAAMLGQDIFPRLAGGAVTGVCTRVRLCGEHEPEEMRVHFLSRSAFDDILKLTQRAIQDTSNTRLRETYAAELAILLKASETFGEQYLNGDEPSIEIVPRSRWQEESRLYIEEPARDSTEPRLIRLIDYVEYTLHASEHALLPPGSVLVDLPGGAAGQLRHETILRQELNAVDAVVLVIGNNRFGDDDRTQRVFEQVRRKVVQDRSPEVAARMISLAVTHWDEINSAASLEKALGSLRPLLRVLPTNYSSYHHHGPGN
ncbi:MAG TPA: dynamin family protein, partial [Ktedonobacteraceae bacterium]|nr:dynamin family protein [Ktedonobacteraceae bacterium]